MTAGRRHEIDTRSARRIPAVLVYRLPHRPVLGRTSALQYLPHRPPIPACLRATTDPSRRTAVRTPELHAANPTWTRPMRNTEKEKENSMNTPPNTKPIPVAELVEIETHADPPIRRTAHRLGERRQRCRHDRQARARIRRAGTGRRTTAGTRLRCDGCRNALRRLLLMSLATLPFTVSCPSCGAVPGDRCTTRLTRGYHLSRADKAVRVDRRR